MRPSTCSNGRSRSESPTRASAHASRSSSACPLGDRADLGVRDGPAPRASPLRPHSTSGASRHTPSFKRRCCGFLRIPTSTSRRIASAANDAIETFTEPSDSSASPALRLIASVAGRQGRHADASAALEARLVHAEASGDRAERRKVIWALCLGLATGSDPCRRGDPPRRRAAAVGRRPSARSPDQRHAVGAARHGRPLRRGTPAGLTSSAVLDELGLIDDARYRFAAAEAKEFAGDGRRRA